eukprot:scaffold7572_cov124-Isochrysis_galbana.AAC.10
MGDPSRYPEIRTARHLYALRWLGGCLARSAMIKLFYVSGSTTTSLTSTRARSWSFKLEMLTFVGIRSWSTYHNVRY